MSDKASSLRRRHSSKSTPLLKSISSYLQSEAKRFQHEYNKPVLYKISLGAFERIVTLGSGSYGRVMLIKKKDSGQYFAMKILEKKMIVNLKQIEHARSEKRILEHTSHPFLVKMEFFFKDNSYLYLVMPFIAGGELFTFLKKYTFFREEVARFYVAQVCLALEYLHTLKLVHRDLKPENILVDKTGYIKVADFGFCKRISGRTYTFCGTPEYLAPEIILNKGYGFSVDWWSYGILIYELSAGYPPFRHKDVLALFKKISSGKYNTPEHFSNRLRDLLRHMLQLDLSKRYGNLVNGANDIKHHIWFRDTNWLEMFNRSGAVPLKPNIDSTKMSVNFPKCKEERLRISRTDHYRKEFADF